MCTVDPNRLYNYIDIVGALSCDHFVHSVVPCILYLIASLDATFATVNTKHVVRPLMEALEHGDQSTSFVGQLPFLVDTLLKHKPPVADAGARPPSQFEGRPVLQCRAVDPLAAARADRTSDSKARIPCSSAA